jgi:hypothetical protein
LYDRWENLTWQEFVMVDGELANLFWVSVWLGTEMGVTWLDLVGGKAHHSSGWSHVRLFFPRDL